MPTLETPFDKSWWAADLGTARPCDSTYCRHPYETLPPLDESLFRGAFQWLTLLTPELDAEMTPHRRDDASEMSQRLTALRASAAQRRITLPDAFLYFMARPAWQAAIPSCTACYFDLSTGLLPSPVEAGAYLVRFLNDQQDVLAWYLYLPPQGDAYVVCSQLMLDDLDADEPADVVRDTTDFCAPHFEAFIYRFWIENHIWFAQEEGRPLTPVQQTYVDHYIKRPDAQ